jgi:hypothetical protein
MVGRTGDYTSAVRALTEVGKGGSVLARGNPSLLGTFTWNSNPRVSDIAGSEIHMRESVLYRSES